MTDDLYLKMCLALPENFFDGWELQTGDKVIKISNCKQVVYLWKAEEWAWYYNYHPSFSNEVGSAIKLREIKPIPSQEQLQNRVMKKRSLSPYCLAQCFYEWLAYEALGKADSDEWFFVPLVCRWLEYVVYSELSLRWNGEKWL